MLVPILNLAREIYPLANTTIGKQKHKEHGLPPGSPEFWWKMCISAGFVLLGGLFAG